tara:strand:+ start:650 stop:1087 length:438 start_codon:yes stop_codon:yes gene_type:complete
MNPFTPAQTILHQSSEERGLKGMSNQAAFLGPNSMHTVTANADYNQQPSKNIQYQQQNRLQNIETGESAAIADATVPTLPVQGGDPQAFLNLRTAMMMAASGNDSASMQIANMSDPEGAAFRHDIATGKAMALGLDPALASNAIA